MAVFRRDENEASGLSVVFDDDERTAYAYLIRGDEGLADVWLYNVGPAPTEAEWDNPEDAPFRNPAEYVRESDAVAPAQSEDDVRFRWDGNSVFIIIRDKEVARLTPGSQPGWSKGASKDGPLALRWP